MKKALIISAFVVTFILGIVFSELFLQGFNLIFGKGTFDTRAGLREQLDEQKKETEKQLAEAKQDYDRLSADMNRKQANMNSLVKQIKTKLNPQVIKDIILSAPYSETADKGKIFLDAETGGGEGLLKPTTTDDPTVNSFLNAFNDKAKGILDAAKDILKEKIDQLDNELKRINNQLQDRNVQLIGKMKENEKYRKEVDRVNSELKDKNEQLGVKLKEVENLNKEVDRVNEQLQDRNKQLEAKLKEVDRYKKELDDQQKYINDLEGIKSNLEKTVGILETKIENGRLRVSFKGDILFESGKHQLRKEGMDLLRSVLTILKDSTRNNDIFIAGHTDNVPIRADARDRYESNWTLSTYRAIEVVKYLVDQGLSPKHLTAAGYGEYKPVADNSTDEGKTKNRRVELFLIPRIIKR
jgi:chemotaxis protein MotB